MRGSGTRGIKSDAEDQVVDHLIQFSALQMGQAAVVERPTLLSDQIRWRASIPKLRHRPL
jgi:hypothetical protein